MNRIALLGLPIVAITLSACAKNDYPDEGPLPAEEKPAEETPGGGGGGDDPTPPAPAAAVPLADVIDFGVAPTGAATLNTMTCPALSMPKASKAPVVFVDVSSRGAESGTKDAPFRSLEKALGNAAPGAVIYVAAGKYVEQVVIPNKSLTILGGFAAGFASRTDACATVFEAPNMNAPIFATTGDVSFALEGLTVQKGDRGLLVLLDPNLAHGNATIARNVFADNGQKDAVGGAVSLDSVNARVFGNVFRNNTAAKGAALAAGGDVKLTVDQNVVTGSKGYSDHGGGLYISATTTKITRNTFRGNATGVGINGGAGGGWGGAVIIYSNSLNQRANAELSFNVFTENTAGIGGAVFVDDGSIVKMSHDLLYRNRSYRENGTIRGAALYVDGTGNADGGSTFTAEYLTVVNNNYDDKGVIAPQSVGGNVYIEGFSKANVTNSIFWNNGPQAFYVEAGENELTIANSIGPSGCTSGNGEGFINASPTICKIGQGVFQPNALSFANEAADDYHAPTAGNLGAFANMP